MFSNGFSAIFSATRERPRNLSAPPPLAARRAHPRQIRFLEQSPTEFTAERSVQVESIRIVVTSAESEPRPVERASRAGHVRRSRLDVCQSQFPDHGQVVKPGHAAEGRYGLHRSVKAVEGRPRVVPRGARRFVEQRLMAAVRHDPVDVSHDGLSGAVRALRIERLILSVVTEAAAGGTVPERLPIRGKPLPEGFGVRARASPIPNRPLT